MADRGRAVQRRGSACCRLLPRDDDEAGAYRGRARRVADFEPADGYHVAAMRFAGPRDSHFHPFPPIPNAGMISVGTPVTVSAWVR